MLLVLSVLVTKALHLGCFVLLVRIWQSVLRHCCDVLCCAVVVVSRVQSATPALALS